MGWPRCSGGETQRSREFPKNHPPAPWLACGRAGVETTSSLLYVMFSPVRSFPPPRVTLTASELLSHTVPPLQRLPTLSCPSGLGPCSRTLLRGPPLPFLLWPSFSPVHLVLTNTLQNTFSCLVLCVQNRIVEIWETEDCGSFNSSDRSLMVLPAYARGEARAPSHFRRL